MRDRAGRTVTRLLLGAAGAAATVSVSVALAQTMSDGQLRQTVDESPTTLRLADPYADLIRQLGAYDERNPVAPSDQGKNPETLRQIPTPRDDAADGDGTSSPTTGPDVQAPPKTTFNLLDGTSTLAPLDDGTSLPAQRTNRAQTPSTRLDQERTGGVTPGDDQTPANETSRPDRQTVADRARSGALPQPSNPTLGVGITGETLPASSALRTNQAAEALDRARRLKKAGDDDPFGPVGIRVGSSVLYPELIQTLGVSNNIDNDQKRAEGAFSETVLSSRLVSDWSSNAAEFNTRLAYRRNFAGDTPSDPSASADGRLRLDISHQTTATLRGAIDYQREDYSDVFNSGTSGTSDTGKADIFSGSLAGEVSHDFNPISVTGTLTAARKSYSNLPAGSADDDYTTLTAALRTGFNVSPTLKPFVEASASRRTFDDADPLGATGPDRNAWLPALRTGVAVDITEKLRGELALGYAWRISDDKSVPRIGAPTLDANLVWSPHRGTDLTLAARTSFEPDLNGRSASTTYDTSLALAHTLNARTTLTAAARLSYENSTIEDNDKLLLSGEAGFTYWLNRQMAFNASYEHRRALAVLPGNRYSADTVKLGVTLQR
ncbi:outer membrane beta-barrel protein [Jiella sp. MQZ9-1]|uniref:Outer membrane beta-barrel protein n=1 Tax=Jiella flava TaxID=2816857 RepID=A0A939FVY1_9HYPH|nr:outer membrane beta-barrel protein [Jiella flava]MBO0661048.1 outer membrane beta-barrel protein [Jiella flava]MCD2469695.1 outer membrane beta-barrel protein [Jiella flava]